MVDDKKEPTQTPLFDALRPRYQLFIAEYIKHFVGKRAAMAANYTEGTAAKQASKILALDEIQAAIEEAINIKRSEAEQSRQSVIDMLRVMSTTTLNQLTTYDEKKGKLRILFPHEVEEALHPALQLVAYTREGNVEFKGAIQQKAIAQLSAYMLWDKQMRDDNPPVTLSFSGLKPEG